jgi:hypothetical protein
MNAMHLVLTLSFILSAGFVVAVLLRLLSLLTG